MLPGKRAAEMDKKNFREVPSQGREIQRFGIHERMRIACDGATRDGIL